MSLAFHFETGISFCNVSPNGMAIGSRLRLALVLHFDTALVLPWPGILNASDRGAEPGFSKRIFVVVTRDPGHLRADWAVLVLGGTGYALDRWEASATTLARHARSISTEETNGC